MAECQPSKLDVRVRFSLSAPEGKRLGARIIWECLSRKMQGREQVIKGCIRVRPPQRVCKRATEQSEALGESQEQVIEDLNCILSFHDFVILIKHLLFY